MILLDGDLLRSPLFAVTDDEPRIPHNGKSRGGEVEGKRYRKWGERARPGLSLTLNIDICMNKEVSGDGGEVNVQWAI